MLFHNPTSTTHLILTLKQQQLTTNTTTKTPPKPYQTPTWKGRHRFNQHTKPPQLHFPAKLRMLPLPLSHFFCCVICHAWRFGWYILFGLGPMGPMVEEVRRENAKTSRLGGKQKKNGLFRRYLWYSFFWKRDHVFDGFIEYWDPFFLVILYFWGFHWILLV